MTTLYETIFGVEPYNPSNDGAVLTQENLLISLWEIDGTDPWDASSYVRVKPLEVLQPDAATFFGPGFGKNAFPSRQSCRLVVGIDDEDPPFEKTYLALLNPPPEMRQVALNNGVQAAVNPASPVGLDYNDQFGMFLAVYAWTVSFYDATRGVSGFALDTALIQPSVLMGTPLMLPLPFWKTSGADGQAPVPYGPFATPQDIVNAVNAVRAGAPFFVPLVFTFDVETQGPDQYGFILDIRWPFSGASRS